MSYKVSCLILCVFDINFCTASSNIQLSCLVMYLYAVVSCMLTSSLAISACFYLVIRVKRTSLSSFLAHSLPIRGQLAWQYLCVFNNSGASFYRHRQVLRQFRHIPVPFKMEQFVMTPLRDSHGSASVVKVTG